MILVDGHREALLNVTSEAGELVIENTQEDSPSLKWRSEITSSSTALIQAITAIMAITIDGPGGIAVIGTNLSASATLSAPLKNGGGTVTTVALTCIEENIDGTTDWVGWFDDGPIDNYELNIEDAGNPAGYMQITNIICGPAVITEYCAPPETIIGYPEDVEHTITDAFSIRSEGTGAVKKMASIDLNLVNLAEREQFVNSLRTDGRAAVVFVSIYQGWGGSLEAAGAFAAKRMDDFAIPHRIRGRFRTKLDFREI